MTEPDLAERPGLAAQKRAAAVVLEADQSVGLEAGDLGLHHDVPDEPLLPRLRAHVDEADAGELLAAGCLVVVAEQLVPATYREHLGAVIHRTPKRLLLELEEVRVYERLLTVLASAKEEDVDRLHLQVIAAAELDHARVEASPLRSFEQRQDVAAVAVDVHEVRIEPTDGEFHRAQASQ